MDFHPIQPIRPGIISMKNKYKIAQYIWSRFDQQIDQSY